VQVKKENPDAKLGEMAKIIGAKWNELSLEEKAPYQKKADADKVGGGYARAAHALHDCPCSAAVQVPHTPSQHPGQCEPTAARVRMGAQFSARRAAHLQARYEKEKAAYEGGKEEESE
jgi:hypothetical protein